VRQQLDDGPPTDTGGGHGLDPCVALGEHGLTPVDKPPQLPVAADLARARVVDHHLAGPHGLQEVDVALVQRGEYCPAGSARPTVRVCLRASSTASAKSGNHGISTPTLPYRLDTFGKIVILSTAPRNASTPARDEPVDFS